MASVKATITLPEQLLASADAYAEENGLTRSGFIAMTIKQYLQAQEQMPTIVGMMKGLTRLMGEAGQMTNEEIQLQLDDIEAAKRKALGA